MADQPSDWTTIDTLPERQSFSDEAHAFAYAMDLTEAAGKQSYKVPLSRLLGGANGGGTQASDEIWVWKTTGLSIQKATADTDAARGTLLKSLLDNAADYDILDLYPHAIYTLPSQANCTANGVELRGRRSLINFGAEIGTRMITVAGDHWTCKGVDVEGKGCGQQACIHVNGRHSTFEDMFWWKCGRNFAETDAYRTYGHLSFGEADLTGVHSCRQLRFIDPTGDAIRATNNLSIHECYFQNPWYGYDRLGGNQDGGFRWLVSSGFSHHMTLQDCSVVAYKSGTGNGDNTWNPNHSSGCAKFNLDPEQTGDPVEIATSFRMVGCTEITEEGLTTTTGGDKIDGYLRVTIQNCVFRQPPSGQEYWITIANQSRVDPTEASVLISDCDSDKAVNLSTSDLGMFTQYHVLRNTIGRNCNGTGNNNSCVRIRTKFYNCRINDNCFFINNQAAVRTVVDFGTPGTEEQRYIEFCGNTVRNLIAADHQVFKGNIPKRTRIDSLRVIEEAVGGTTALHDTAEGRMRMGLVKHEDLGLNDFRTYKGSDYDTLYYDVALAVSGGEGTIPTGYLPDPNSSPRFDGMTGDPGQRIIMTEVADFHPEYRWSELQQDWVPIGVIGGS